MKATASSITPSGVLHARVGMHRLYARKPARAKKVPAVEKRRPVPRDNQGNWLYDRKRQITSKKIEANREMLSMKKKWQAKQS